MIFKHFRSVMFLCMAFTAMNACKKNNGDSVIPVSDKIKTVNNGTTMDAYSYDSLGRVCKVISSAYGRREYTYTDTAVFIANYSTANAYQNTYNYKLNADGLGIRIYTEGSNDSIYITFSPDHFRQTFKEVIPHAGMPNESYVTTTYHSNGNIDSMQQVHFSGSSPLDSSSRYFTYYLDKPNTLGSENFGSRFTGQSSRNPVKSERLVGHPGVELIANHTYQFDSKNRIIEDITTNSSGTFTSTYTYY